MLRFMGLQRVGHDRATELNRTEDRISGKEIFRLGDLVLTLSANTSSLTLVKPKTNTVHTIWEQRCWKGVQDGLASSQSVG